MQATGAVEVVSAKTESKQGKPFRSPLYSIKLSDGKWYGCGFKNPSVQQGDNISFDFSVGAHGNDMNVASIERVQATTTAASSARAVPASPDARQSSIVYQSSRKDAINLLTLAVANDLIKLPKASGYDALLGLVDDLTLDFARKAISPDLSQEAEAVVEVVGDE